MPFFPFPESLVAMGPERKATEATGPVTEVAKATRRSARRISVSRDPSDVNTQSHGMGFSQLKHGELSVQEKDRTSCSEDDKR